jgi:hypothetical protein
MELLQQQRWCREAVGRGEGKIGGGSFVISSSGRKSFGGDRVSFVLMFFGCGAEVITSRDFWCGGLEGGEWTFLDRFFRDLRRVEVVCVGLLGAF